MRWQRTSWCLHRKYSLLTKPCSQQWGTNVQLSRASSAVTLERQEILGVVVGFEFLCLLPVIKRLADQPAKLTDI